MSVKRYSSLLLLILTSLLIFNEKDLTYPQLPEKFFTYINKYLYIGSYYSFIIIAISTYLVLYIKKHKNPLLHLYSAVTLIFIFYLKKIFSRAGSEFDGKFFQEITIGLFPSGHTYLTLLISYLIFYTTKKITENKKIINIILIVLIVNLFIMTTALTFSNYHYISDITASILFFILYLTFSKKIIK
jgi:hypothetical protein